MRKLAEVSNYLSADELKDRFRRCRNALEKTYWQAILLRKQGWGTNEVAKICGFRSDWIRQLVRRYNADGVSAIRDRRKDNGKKKMLSDGDLADLRKALLESRPRDGGVWTGPKVAKWMSERLGREVKPQRAWDYLQRLKMSKQTPRPKHAHANVKDQERFKKNSAGGYE